jgi:hypothetical protein
MKSKILDIKWDHLMEGIEILQWNDSIRITLSNIQNPTKVGL